MKTPTNCPCVYCEVDRENGRPVYLARWRDTRDYYAPDRYRPSVSTQREAMRFGPRHVFGPALVRVRLRDTQRHEAGR
jgi:hypothetical protein